MRHAERAPHLHSHTPPIESLFHPDELGAGLPRPRKPPPGACVRARGTTNSPPRALATTIESIASGELTAPRDIATWLAKRLTDIDV